MSESVEPETEATATAREIDPALTACLFASFACEMLDQAAEHARNLTEGAHALVVEAFLRYMKARGCFDTSEEKTG
jgi:hypothetical protein